MEKTRGTREIHLATVRLFVNELMPSAFSRSVGCQGWFMMRMFCTVGDNYITDWIECLVRLPSKRGSVAERRQQALVFESIVEG